MIKQIALWIALLIPDLLTKGLAMVLAPMVALFVTKAERTDRVKRLGNQQVTMLREYIVKPLYWFQTHDNAVDEWWWGCFNESSALAYFREATEAEYHASAFFRYACRVMWLWRNSAYGFAYHLYGRVLGETISTSTNGDESKGFWYLLTRRKSSWQLKMKIPAGSKFFININIGWKTHKGFPRCMYAGRLIGTDSRN